MVDADALVHQLQKPGGRLYQILVEHFGEKVLLEDGELNRPLLASLIFSNSEEREWSKETQGKIIRDESVKQKNYFLWIFHCFLNRTMLHGSMKLG